MGEDAAADMGQPPEPGSCCATNVKTGLPVGNDSEKAAKYQNMGSSLMDR